MMKCNREALYKKIFLLSDWAAVIRSVVVSLSGFVFALASVIFFCLLIFDFGFRITDIDADVIKRTYLLLLLCFFCGKLIIEISSFNSQKWPIILTNFVILGVTFLILLVYLECIDISSTWLTAVFDDEQALIIGSVVLMLTEINHLSNYFSVMNISASFLFAGSFLLMIFIGSGLLMMPNATVQPITYLDALFTATSAICVTGLTVIDTATAFTPLGQGIIMVLIQIGGLGIMTFTGFFSYIFLGSVSFKGQFLLKDFFSSENLSGLYKLLLKILLFTILLEAAGAALIYNALEGYWLHKLQDSVFHAISAFCNAGFSVYPQGLYTASLHFNYPLQVTICALIFLGGIGFPLLLTFYNVLKHLARSLFYYLTGRKMPYELIRLSTGERLALNTTIVLLIIGTAAYYGFEANSQADGAGVIHHVMTAFFASVSARTAGFNVADLAMWSYPTVFLIMFLMWVGASPGSTGGGIKTTTLAVAAKAVINFLRGKNELEIGNREIGMPTIFRVLAVILLSLVFIFFAFMLMLIFEPSKPPVHLLFECVSAFSTTGLSVVKTESLRDYSKVVLMILMFAGRIGPVVLLSGFLLTKTNKLYRLPVENIRIN
ncbi:MAG: potassium transporter TrkG [Smithella sp.]